MKLVIPVTVVMIVVNILNDTFSAEESKNIIFFSIKHWKNVTIVALVGYESVLVVSGLTVNVSRDIAS